MTSPRPMWPDTSGSRPPADHLYRSATWLLGRHPRLARLAERVRGVVEIHDGQLGLGLDHLADVIAAVPLYAAAWDAYEHAHREPEDELAWERWRGAGPDPDSLATGLSDFLVMSSGEVTSLRLLATFAAQRAPFRVGDFASLDAEGQRLLADWAHAVTAAHGVPPRPPRTSSSPALNAQVPVRGSRSF